MKDIEPDSGKPVLPIARHQWISVAAYYKAEYRGFDPGHELDDWLAAEKNYIEMMIASYLALAEEDGDMTIVGLRQLAEAIGVENPEGLDSAVDLIRAIQNVSQTYSCFQFDSEDLCHERAACQWKKECRKMTAVWKR